MLLVEIESGTPYLVRFMVDAARQRQGIGRQAVELLVDELRDQGWATLAASFLPVEDGGRGLLAPLASPTLAARSTASRSSSARSSDARAATSDAHDFDAKVVEVAVLGEDGDRVSARGRRDPGVLDLGAAPGTPSGRHQLCEG